MTADQLRRALDTDGKLIGRGGIEHPFVTAARSWLSLLEADEMIVEKMLPTVGWLGVSLDEEIPDVTARAFIRLLLAAIVGKET